MSDERVWQTIGGKKQCAYKMTSETQMFCKHPNNVTNLCEQASCPLANSKYATVREDNNKLYLYIKEPERCNTPKLAYEAIELSNDHDTALKQIDTELELFSDYLKHKCKQRLTKLTEYLLRKDTVNKNQYTVEKKKFKRKEKILAEKTKKKIDLEKEIEMELVERMNSGVYGNEVKSILQSREKNKKIETKKEAIKKRKKKFLAHFEESDDYMSAKDLKKLKW